MQVRGKLSPRSDFALGLTGILVVVAVWCALTYSGAIKPLFLPSPTLIWEGATEFAKQGWLVDAVKNSTIRVFLSLLLVTAVGVPVGVLMGAFPQVDAVLRKIVSAGKSVPTTGLVGLVVLWFSVEEKAKIVFLFLGAIFYMIVLVKNAVASVREDYVRVALDMGANQGQVLTKVLVPGALPQIWEAVAVCNGIMWTYIVLAEYINSNVEQIGLGYLLNIGSRTQDSGKVFATLILIGLVSTATDWLMQTVKKRFFAW